MSWEFAIADFRSICRSLLRSCRSGQEGSMHDRVSKRGLPTKDGVPALHEKKMRCEVPLCWPTPRGGAWRLLWSPTSPGLVYNLEAQQQVWGDLGTDACITLALQSLDLIGCRRPSAAKSAALSEGHLGANGGYSSACPIKMLLSRNFVDTGVCGVRVDAVALGCSTSRLASRRRSTSASPGSLVQVWMAPAMP